jgi:hypothetical protein
MAVDTRASSEGVELGFNVGGQPNTAKKVAVTTEVRAAQLHVEAWPRLGEVYARSKPTARSASIAGPDQAVEEIAVTKAATERRQRKPRGDRKASGVATFDGVSLDSITAAEFARKIDAYLVLTGLSSGEAAKKKQAAKKEEAAKKEAVKISSESEDEPSRCDKARERSAAQDQAPADAAQEVAALAAEAPTAVDFADSSSEEDAQLSMLDAMAAKASVAIAEVEMALARIEVRAPADASAPDAAPDVALNALGRQDQDQEGFMVKLKALDNEYGEAPLRERARYKSAGAWRAIVDAARCLGKKVVNVLGDGNCLFRAICRVKDGTEDGHAVLREVHGREKRPGKEGDDDDLQEISTALRRTILVLVGDSATGLYREFRPEVAVSMEEERMPIVVAFHRNHYYGVVDAGGENEEIEGLQATFLYEEDVPDDFVYPDVSESGEETGVEADAATPVPRPLPGEPALGLPGRVPFAPISMVESDSDGDGDGESDGDGDGDGESQSQSQSHKASSKRRALIDKAARSVLKRFPKDPAVFTPQRCGQIQDEIDLVEQAIKKYPKKNELLNMDETEWRKKIIRALRARLKRIWPGKEAKSRQAPVQSRPPVQSAQTQVEQKIHAITSQDGKIRIHRSESSSDNAVILLPSATDEITYSGPFGDRTLVLPPGVNEVLLYLKFDAPSAQGNRDAAARSSEKTASGVGADTRGKEQLRYIARALGNGLGGLVTLGEMNASLSGALKAGEVVHGVDFREVYSEIVQRVRSSATAEMYLEWLASRAQTYASTGVPQSIHALVSGILSSAAVTAGEFAPMTAGNQEWRSPLNAVESAFARLHFNAVRAAAKALNADEAELAASLNAAERESVASVARSRYYNVRANYLYAIAHDGVVYIYVGESMDPEARLNAHLVAILDGDAGHKQRGHAVVCAAREGSANDNDAFAFRAWVLVGYDEASAVQLCRSYIKFVGIGGRKSNHILEIARAIAGAGFAAEAVYTAHFRSLNDHSIDGVVGLNFSQPGMIFNQAQEDPSWRDIAALDGTAWKAKQPRTFKCYTCSKIKKNVRVFWTRGGEGNGELYEQCGVCQAQESLANRQPKRAGPSKVRAASIGGHARADRFRELSRNALIPIEHYWDAVEKRSTTICDKNGLKYRLARFNEALDYLSDKQHGGHSVANRSRVVLVRDGPKSTNVRAKMFFNVKEAEAWLQANNAENLFGCVQPTSRAYNTTLTNAVRNKRDQLEKKNNARGN